MRLDKIRARTEEFRPVLMLDRDFSKNLLRSKVLKISTYNLLRPI
jgi:hypothetical protein